MINIIKQGNNVVITSDNPNAFNIGNGELSVPLNTIYYVLDDESDFIQFNSTEEGSILFNGTIGNIQVNGTLVTRDNIITQLDSVFNSATGEGGGGVESVNGLTGAVLLKSINGEQITGSGDIEISGGGTSGVEYISTSSVPSEWDTFKGGVKLTTGFTNFDEGDVGYDIFINGNLADGTEAGSLWFGIRSTDASLQLTDGGGRLDLQVNPDNFKTVNGNSIIGSGDIEISGGGSETDPIFDAWKNGNAIALGMAATASGNRANAIGTESQATSLWANAFGYQAKASQTYSLALGTQAKATALNAIAIGYNTSGATSGGVVIGNGIGVGTVDEASYKTNINNVIKGDSNSFAFVKSADGSYVQIHTEWTGTQSEYDALGTYYDTITYNIIEG